MAKKRRTSNVQRQRPARGPESAHRPWSGSALPDWRLLLIGGVIVVGVLILALVLLFGGGPAANLGVQQADDGRTHVADGTDCRNDPAQCGTNPYSSVPAVSGPHWGRRRPGASTHRRLRSPSPSTTSSTGIVIWYDPEALTVESIDELTTYVQNQNATGLSGRYKFILSPWGGSEPLLPGRGDGLAMDPRARHGRHRRDRRVRAGPLRRVARAERRSRAIRLTPIDPAERLRHHPGGRLAQRQSK